MARYPFYVPHTAIPAWPPLRCRPTVFAIPGGTARVTAVETAPPGVRITVEIVPDAAVGEIGDEQ
jgi:hypothetical protein